MKTEDISKLANDELYKLRESQLMTNIELKMQSGKIQELHNDKIKLQVRITKLILRNIF